MGKKKEFLATCSLTLFSHRNAALGHLPRGGKGEGQDGLHLPSVEWTGGMWDGLSGPFWFQIPCLRGRKLCCTWERMRQREPPTRTHGERHEERDQEHRCPESGMVQVPGAASSIWEALPLGVLGQTGPPAWHFKVLVNESGL